MVGIGAFLVFIRTRRNIEPFSSLKPIKVDFMADITKRVHFDLVSPLITICKSFKKANL